MTVRPKTTAADRILIIDDVVPSDDLGRGYPRMLNILHELARFDADVTLVADNPAGTEVNAPPLRQLGIDVVTGKDDYCRWLEDRLFEYSAVIVSRPHLFQKFQGALARTQPQAVRVYDVEGLWFRRTQRMIPFLHDDERRAIAEREARELETLEREAMAWADQLLCVSEIERAAVREMCPGKPLWLVSTYIAPKQDPPPYRQRSGILFLGAFANVGSPNEDGALHLVNDIMPRVWEMDPGVEVSIVGYAPTPAVAALARENVAVAGSVDDLTPWLDKARVHACAVRFESGLQLKLVTTIGAGLPFVGYAEPIEGLGADEPLAKHVTAATTAEFVERLWDLYSSEELWTRVQNEVVGLAGRKYSRAQFSETVDRFMAGLGAIPRELAE